MTLTLHNLKGLKNKKKKRLGRGNASGKGTYSGRGLKGQRARSGGKSGLKLRGFKQNLLNLPKFKGMKSLTANNQVVNLSSLEKNYKDGEKVNPESLLKNKLIDTIKVPVKILNNGELKTKLEVEDCLVSNSAKAVIEKVGGRLVVKEEKVEKKKEENKK